MKPKRMFVTRIVALILTFSVITLSLCAANPTPEQVDALTKLLFLDIRSNNIERAKARIKAGANVNAMDDGESCLMYAVKYGSKELVDMLIKAGADVNAKDDYSGGTVLMYALIGKPGNIGNIANKDVVDIVKLLVGAGANVNARDDDGNAVLVYAVIRGYEYDCYIDIVELLIKAGADVNAKNNDGNSVLSSRPLKTYFEYLLKAYGAKE